MAMTRSMSYGGNLNLRLCQRINTIIQSWLLLMAILFIFRSLFNTKWLAGGSWLALAAAGGIGGEEATAARRLNRQPSGVAKHVSAISEAALCYSSGYSVADCCGVNQSSVACGLRLNA